MYHLEDLPKSKLKQLFNPNPVLTLSEKFDGSAFSIGVDTNKQIYVKTKTNCWHSEDEVPNTVFFRDIKKTVQMIFSPLHRTMFKTMYCFLGAFELQGELIPVYDWNTVIYPKEKLGSNFGLFIVFSCKKENTYCPFDYIKILKENYFIPNVIKVEEKYDSDITHQLWLFKTKHQELINKAVERGNKSEEQELRQLLREFTKTQVIRLEQFYHYDYHPEGFVVRVGNDFSFKLVDKDDFTVKNKKNWEKIAEINNFKKQLEKINNKEERAAFRSEFMKHWYCFECSFPNPRKFRETTEYLREIIKSECSFTV